MRGCVILVRHFVFRRRGAMSICVWAIQTSKKYLIKNKKSNQWSSLYARVIGILVMIVISNVLA